MKFRNILVKTAILTLLLFFIAGSINAENDKRGKKSSSYSPTGGAGKANATNATGKVGDSYVMQVNNVYMPMNSSGTLADVQVPGEDKKGGYYGENIFLFSGGFMLSGYADGVLWANAQASASLIENYVPGTVEGGMTDPRAQIYVVNRTADPVFGEAWQEWKDAVALGADFYDGDGDGEYNPVDLNGNEKWDPTEDRPDILGDETAWTVYNDGQPLAQRSRFPGVRPYGIEVRQTVFGFESQGPIGNIIFIRYRLKNTGRVADTLKNVIFGAWADPDLGDHEDDLVGVDTVRNAGYVYQKTTDDQWGVAPTFMIDFFSGPAAYIPGETFIDANGNGMYDDGETALDTAYSVRGTYIGVEAIPGARNLGVSSFVHYKQSDPTLGDPNVVIEARNYMLGLDKEGEAPDPCDWPLSNTPPNCEDVNNRYWYSGDPVAGTGWLHTDPYDQRQMQNTGPFDLVKDREVEIVVAYIIGLDDDKSVESIIQARQISDGAQFIFDNNFQAPSPGPTVDVTVKSTDDFIDLIWDAAPQVNYVNADQDSTKYKMVFEGYKVWTFRTNSVAEEVALIENRKVLTRYDLDNRIENLYRETAPGQYDLLWSMAENQLDPEVYSDPETDKIRLRIDQDPWTEGPLTKGKPYYFAITAFYRNALATEFIPARDAAENVDSVGNYMIQVESLFDITENGVQNIITAVPGEDLYDPPLRVENAEHVQGHASGELAVDFYNKEELTGDDYQINFMIDSASTEYDVYWQLENKSSGNILIDSSKTYLFGDDEISNPPISSQGLVVKLSQATPSVGTVEYDSESMSWVDVDWTRVTAVTDELTAGSTISALPMKRSTYWKADELARVVLKFGEQGKAYRYLNAFVPENAFEASRYKSYFYAEAATAEQVQKYGGAGKLKSDGSPEGFVDVNFTAWIDDPTTGEMRQLAVGFIERAVDRGGNPDGNWTPPQISGTVNELADSLQEYILVFNSTYDPSGNQPVYKGGTYIGDDAEWASLKGYELPEDANVTAEQRAIAESPYFDAPFVFEIVANTESPDIQAGDEFVIPVTSYPYTPEDVFEFTTRSGGDLTNKEEEELFEKVNVFPNPLFGFNVATSYSNSAPDEPFVTFSNLPPEVTVKIYSLSGQHLRTLTTADKQSPTSTFLRWNLQNDQGLRVASGMYLAIVSSPKYGEKVLKFAIIMPQKQIQKY